MFNSLSAHHPTISDFTKKFLAEQKEKFKDHFWAEDYFTRLEKYMLSGKMIRGSLIMALYEIFTEKEKLPPSNHRSPITNCQLAVIKTATAMEFMQAALLMHDDILDKDELRRGSPAIHTQYKNWAEKEKEENNSNSYSKPHSDNHHFGQGMAICGGDIAFGFCFSLLADLKIATEIKTSLQALFSQELVGVALAEARDFEMAFTDRKISKEDIIKMYRYKTGRYSISLPIMAGAILAGNDLNSLTTKTLEKIGENLGIIFQIKDDEIGIFGDKKRIGKPSGSDIKEGKKTLLWYYLNRIGAKTAQQTLSFFGKQNLTEKEIKIVHQSIKDNGILEKIEKDVEKLTQKTTDLITKLKLSKKGIVFFENLIKFSVNRKK